MAIKSSISSLSKESILERLPGKFPIAQIPHDVDPEAAARAVVEQFPALEASDFVDDSLWRDSYGLTGTMRTFYSKEKIHAKWRMLSKQRGVTSVEIVQGSSQIRRIDSESAWVECRFVFETSSPETKCSGFLSLIPGTEGGKWKIWILRTILEQLIGHGNVDELEPCAKHQEGLANGHASSHHLDGASNGYASELPNGVANGFTNVHTSGITNGAHSNTSDEKSHFQAAIIGGGQSGLSTGGRLQALGVSYVVLERNKYVGEAWRKRYESARLHTIREYAHLPFERNFGPEYGEYLGKEALADGHRKWAEDYGINIWLSTSVESGYWNEEQKLFTLNIRKNGVNSTITAKHVVFATGAGSETPVMPTIPGQNKFRGTVLHSVQYRSAENWKGKSGIVIGTANTGHDVADDMYEAGMAVTMIQRSRTYVLPLEYIEDRYSLLYNDKIPTELSDRIQFSSPVSIARLMSAKAFHAMARAQPERWEALERAGFKVDPFGDIQNAINIRLGGHYIDVGTSAKIAKGLIKVKSDVSIVQYTENGLLFSDGSELEADVIVFATGFVGNLRDHVQQTFGKEVADRAGDCFGLNEEGEVLGAFKPLPQPGLWYLGGSLGNARYCSRFIALSIKADDLGTPLPVYTDDEHSLDCE